MAILACALTLGACAPRGAGVDAVERGLAAYRAGDQMALSSIVDDLDAGGDAVVKLCSNATFADARRAVAREVLTQLNNGALMSMSAEARYVFLTTRDPTRSLQGGIPGRACPKASLPQQAQDVFERIVIAKAMVDEAKDWRNALAAEYGPQEFAQRQAVARKTLRVNHVSRTRGWTDAYDYDRDY
jgi:hypothetical protein